MKKAPITTNEDSRLCAVFGLKILDTQTEERFDIITKKAVQLFKVPISTITIVDRDREWYKSAQGIDVKEAPRDISFCGHALIKEELLVIEDTTKNPDFADNPYVTRLKNPIRFYAGKSLYSHKENQPVGVFCIKDYVARSLSVAEVGQFLELAEEAEKEINRV